MFDRRWLLVLGFGIVAVFAAANPATAGVLDASWGAPTTNTDGTALTDLASYRVYYSTSATPCPGSTFASVASSTTTPPPNQIVSLRLTGLVTGSTYTVSVTAVDLSGNQSACSTPASAVAQVEIGVTPTGSVNFGNVNVGSSVTQNFTVQSTRTGTVTGSASVPAPFSIVSGSPFTLNGTGATATVTVGFVPTSATVTSTNLNFTADGDTVSRLVSGTGVSGTGSTLTVSKVGAGSGTVTSNPGGITCGTTCSASFPNNTMVTLTAMAGTGSTFAGWIGACAGAGTCTVTMSAPRAVTATFYLNSSVGFTDNPLVAQTTVVKATHIVELRNVIAAAWTRNGVGVATWAETLVPGTTPIKAAHILELRTAANQVYQKLGSAQPTYTDSITAGQTVIKAVYIQELRNAVSALP